MNKNDFIRAYADIRDKSKGEARDDVDAMLELLTSSLAKGKSVRFSGAFSMERVKLAPRRYRNPSTGELEVSQPRYSIRFKSGSDFEKMLQGQMEGSDGK